MKLIYKKVPFEDWDMLFEVINKVLFEMERKEFFIPYTTEELEKIFDESYAFLHGAYDGDKLVGIAQLYVDQEMLKEYAEILNISNEAVCELGGNLVLSEYRGLGIMTSLIKIQLDLAFEKKYNYVIAMAHPDNIGSIKAIERLGLNFVRREVLNNDFLRNIYMKELCT